MGDEKTIFQYNKSLSELVRLKYKYRELIMRRKIKIPQQKAARLIGPDCAYHLYSAFQGNKKRSS
jgi:hypothetical protein